jgi:hypothetical protein
LGARLINKCGNVGDWTDEINCGGWRLSAAVRSHRQGWVGLALTLLWIFFASLRRHKVGHLATNEPWLAVHTKDPILCFRHVFQTSTWHHLEGPYIDDPRFPILAVAGEYIRKLTNASCEDWEKLTHDDCLFLFIYSIFMKQL